MNWYKTARSSKLDKSIRHILHKSSLVRYMLKGFKLPEDVIDFINFDIKDLDGKFAEGNGKTITLDKKLFKDKDFFEENFHFVIHEFNHCLKRISEKLWYFNDREEVQSFVFAVAWELETGKDDKQIKAKFLPIILTHFDDKKEGLDTFVDILNRAKDLKERIYE